MLPRRTTQGVRGISRCAHARYRYGEAARSLTEALRLAPPSDTTDITNSQAVDAALADIPPQTVTFGSDVPVRAALNGLGTWDVPVDVNGRRSQLIFDTGANWSTISAGEAERLNIKPRESDAYVRGLTGKRTRSAWPSPAIYRSDARMYSM